MKKRNGKKTKEIRIIRGRRKENKGKGCGVRRDWQRIEEKNLRRNRCGQEIECEMKLFKTVTLEK